MSDKKEVKEVKEYQEALDDLTETAQKLNYILINKEALNVSKDKEKSFKELFNEAKKFLFDNLNVIIDSYKKGDLLEKTALDTFTHTLVKLEQLSKLPLFANNPNAQKAIKGALNLFSQNVQYFKTKNNQMTLWSDLNNDVKKKLEDNNLTPQTFSNGISLTPPQMKLMICLMQLIDNNEDLKGINVKDAKGVVMRPVVECSLHEITKLYVGGVKNITAKDLKQVMAVINTLNEKKFLTVYREMRQIKRGKKIESVEHERQRFHDFLKVESLYFPTDIKDVKRNDFEAFKEDFKEANSMVKKAKEVIITLSLNPIFSSQLDSSYVLFPENFIERLNKANGGGKISMITTRLIIYMMLKKTFSSSFKISLENLRWMVAETQMGESKIKRVNTGLKKAFKVATNIGLLKTLEVNQSTGVASFFLDRDFHKKQISYKEPKRLTINKLNK